MLLFEFDAALFQLEHREPEFEPLFQLPPNSAVLLPRLPLLLPSLDPSAQHCSNLCDQYLRRLKLMHCHASNRVQESHPEPQMCQTGIRSVNF
jgi:hypothetical protein